MAGVCLFERRIKELCARLLAEQDADAFHFIAEELRMTIHAHIEDLRCRLIQLPVARHDDFEASEQEPTSMLYYCPPNTLAP